MATISAIRCLQEEVDQVIVRIVGIDQRQVLDICLGDNAIEAGLVAGDQLEDAAGGGLDQVVVRGKGRLDGVQIDQ